MKIYLKKQWGNFQAFYRKWRRIIVGSANSFVENNDYLKASALTYYSLISIVPLLAVAFGLASGFGFSEFLERQLVHTFEEQPEMIKYSIEFARSMLKSTQSGVIAGVGLATLLWSIISMLGSLEGALNDIWKAKRPRTWLKKFTDYLAVMVLCPLFFIISSSLSVYLMTQITESAKEITVVQWVSPLLLFVFNFVPLILTILLFIVIYLFIPNTQVHVTPRVIAGIIAGVVFQFWQWFYLKFQVLITSYDVIYGTFAALPLFLIWLIVSWLIILAGAELAAHIENELTFIKDTPEEGMRQVTSKTLGILILSSCIRAYHQGEPPMTTLQIAQSIGCPLLETQRMVDILVEAGLLVEVMIKSGYIYGYQPSKDARLFTVYNISTAIEQQCERYAEVLNSPTLTAIDHTRHKLEHVCLASQDNLDLNQIALKHHR